MLKLVLGLSLLVSLTACDIKKAYFTYKESRAEPATLGKRYYQGKLFALAHADARKEVNEAEELLNACIGPENVRLIYAELDAKQAVFEEQMPGFLVNFFKGDAPVFAPPRSYYWKYADLMNDFPAVLKGCRENEGNTDFYEYMTLAVSVSTKLKPRSELDTYKKLPAANVIPSPNKGENPVGGEVQAPSAATTLVVPAPEGKCDYDYANRLKNAGIEFEQISIHGPIDEDFAGFGCPYRISPAPGSALRPGQVVKYRSAWEGG